MSTLRIKGSDGVVIESQKFLELPKAPTKTTSDTQRSGMIRYNTEWNSFEGTLEFDDGSISYRRFANLDQNGKLLSSQLPDSVLNGLKYIGTYSPLTDDVDPPDNSSVNYLTASSSSNTGYYYIVRGIYDAAVTHYSANSPSTSPVIFTPTNPNGGNNWLQIKYYFSTDPYNSAKNIITSAYAIFITAQVPTDGTHPGLVQLITDSTLTTAFTTDNSNLSETAISDSDWIISTGTTWQRQRESRTSISASAVLYDRTDMYSHNRSIIDSTGTLQTSMDYMVLNALRRSGDSMYDNGNLGSGRFAAIYGSANAPAITFNSTAFDATNNPGNDPSKWSDTNTGIFHPSTLGAIAFTSTGTEKLRILPEQIIFYSVSDNSNTNPNILFTGTNNNNLGIVSLNNSILLVSDNQTNVEFDKNSTIFYGNISNTGNTTLGDSSTDTLTVNATSTFANNVSVNGNTTLGDASTDTLTVNATSTFVNNVSVNGNTTLGDTSTDTLTVNATSTFVNAATFDTNITVLNNATIDNNLTVLKNTTLGTDSTNTLSVNSVSTFNNGLTSSALIVNHNSTLGTTSADTLTVNAASTFNSNATVVGNLVVDGSSTLASLNTTNLTVSGTLGVTGATTLSTLSTSGLASLNSATISGTLTANGNINLGDASSDTLTVTATSAFGSTASFGGSVNFNGSTNIKANATIGTTSSNTLTVNSVSAFGASATFNGNAFLYANTTIGTNSSNTLTVNATSTLSGAVSLTSTLNVTGATTLTSLTATNVTANGTLSVSGTSTVAALNATNISASGTLSVTGNSTLSTLTTSGLATLNSAGITNNATVGGTLGVTGATTLSTLSTTGLATLNSTSVTGNATIGGTLTVTGVSTFNNATNTFAGITLANAGTFTLANTTSSATITKTASALNINASNFDDVIIYDGSTIRTKFSQYGVQLPTVATVVNANGSDGMIAYTTSNNSLMQRNSGVWYKIPVVIVETFLNTDWVLSGSYYTLTYNVNNATSVQVQQLESDSSYTVISVDTISITSTTVTLKVPSTTDLRFSGRCIINA